LNDLLARLRQSIGAQRAFIADAAHELRTPLTALQLQIQLAERAQTPAERAQAFGELKQGYMRAMNMVQQLLTLARQEPDAAEMRREPVALRALAQQAVADHAALAEERGIDLGIAEAAEVSVAGDPDALRILLGNLVSNALRYTPRGGRVDVHVVKDGHDTVLAVQDTGPGIPEQDLARVFDRFYRVPGTAEVGSGLGLAIAKQIAEAHGALLTLGNTHPGLRAELRWKG
ncbi:MAG TPA: ATP-binding protein, partial [Noviherbaspirillum sp.]|nr:ATP-binding protein [Noviherbaspirillum sp.]